MLALARADGITDMVATPHSDLRYSFDPVRCRTALHQLRIACPEAPRIHLGCELHLAPENIERVLRSPAQFTLNGGDCLLLELPRETAPQMFEPGVCALLDRGLRLVIAHPERNPSLQRNRSYLLHLSRLGCYFQLTAQSLNGTFGPAAQSLAHDLLQRRFVHIVASDSHGIEHRRPLLAFAFDEVARRLNQASARLLFVDNPCAALASQPLLPLPASTYFPAILRNVFRFSAHGNAAYVVKSSES